MEPGTGSVFESWIRYLTNVRVRRAIQGNFPCVVGALGRTCLVEPGRDGEYTLGTYLLSRVRSVCTIHVAWRVWHGVASGDCLGLCSSDDMYVVYL